MVNWIVIGIILIAVVLFYKFTAFKYGRFWTYSIAILMIFLLFSFFTIVKTNQVDISNVNGFITGTKFYAGWLLGWGKNAAKITGQITNDFPSDVQNITNTISSEKSDSEPEKKGW